MKLDKLIADLPVTIAGGPADLDVIDVVEDSRQVAPGALFVARKGAVSDGRRFIADAVRAGAIRTSPARRTS
jgi:UDP-N-acetylmuramyl tripeptide synthase